MRRFMVVMAMCWSVGVFAQWVPQPVGEVPPSADALAPVVRSVVAMPERGAGVGTAGVLDKLGVEPAATCSTYQLPYAGVSQGLQLWGVVDRFIPGSTSCYLTGTTDPWDFWAVPVRPGEKVTIALETSVRTYFSIDGGDVFYGSTVLQSNGKYLGGYVWNVPDYWSDATVRVTVSPYAASARYTLAVAKPATSQSCVGSSSALCLNASRFRVEASYVTPSATGNGTAVALTSDTGYFWFFSSANVEVIVKVLDGRGVNGKFWVYAAGLTDVDTLIRITDTQTGVVKTYRNPANTPFRPIQDTSAF